MLRLIRLIEILDNSQGSCCSELCAQLQVNRRTLYRDLELLRVLGHELIKESRETKVFYRLKLDPFVTSTAGHDSVEIEDELRRGDLI